MNTLLLVFVVAFAVISAVDGLKCAGGKKGEHEYDCKENAKKCYTLFCGRKKSAVEDRGCEWNEMVLLESGFDKHHQTRSLRCQEANKRLCDGLGTCRLCTKDKCNGDAKLSFLFLPILTSLALTAILK